MRHSSRTSHFCHVLNPFFVFGCFAVCALFFFSPLSLSAQTIGGSLGLTLDPRYPEPYSEVTVSIDDYTIQTTGSTIAWFVNDVEIPESSNRRSLIVATEGLGSKTDVMVVLQKTGAPRLSKKVTITPTIVDIILESDTYTPVFYKGRALPSIESTLRAIAIVQTGTAKPASAYSYTWSENSSVKGGGEMRGQNVYTFTAPRFRDSILSVEVVDDAGISIAQKSILVATTEPELYFYEENPLRGILKRALTSPHQLLAEETTLYAEPYYLPTPSLVGGASLEWNVNGVPVVTTSAYKNALTLTREGSAAEATIGFTAMVSDSLSLPRSAEGDIQLFFK